MADTGVMTQPMPPILVIGKYLYAVHENASSGKTQVWAIRSTRDGAVLGEVRWFGRWRQYALFPAPGTVFNTGCMAELITFIKDRMAERGR